MKFKLFVFEIAIEALLCFSLFPIIYGFHEVYLQFFTQNYEYQGDWVESIRTILLTSVFQITELVLIILVLHIPISFYLRNRLAKQNFKVMRLIKIILGTYFMVLLIYLLIYNYYFIQNYDFQNIYMFIPSLMVVLLPPLLTAWRYGKSFEYYE